MSDIFIDACPSEIYSPSGVKWKTLYKDLCDTLCSRHVDNADSDFKEGRDIEARWTRKTAYDSLKRAGEE
jgi:hypothetical protein